ncbi:MULTISPECIES: hypothetical protein [unclassified Mesorhizobium]|uniref:hypothetical protein n=1 Tax=unclassified Mesorhizobium TaxID=325217 RepID=UPI001126F0BD|nr:MULTISPECIES: hypothetical protein [unclassified Mesorhizobium]TPL42607.1 hypothetical protein FJ961_07915 [Mesorhizobium sp. B2-4-5]TPL66610.1 hypothetical protein FJ949_09595 [Mesorhizobium sp. B2-4-1]
MAQNFRGKIIEAGYPWSIRIQFTNSINFPVEATFTSQVREKPESALPIIELTTANGGVVRLDSVTLEIHIPETSPGIWPVGKTVVLDVIRTDGTQNEHLGILLQVPVRNPVTRL